jgi:hypothetical protein
MVRQCSPYHSIGRDSKVYHVYSDCAVGNNIERDKRRPGTGGKRLCSTCKDIRAGRLTK